MKKTAIPQDLFVNNRKSFSGMMKPGSVAIFLSNDEFPRNGDQTFRYRQNSDLFYLTGIEQEKTILLLFPACPNPELREVLFVIQPNEALVTWEGRKLSRNEATAISGIEKIKWTGQFDVILTEVMTYAESAYLNSVEYIKYFNEVPYREMRFAGEIRKRFPNHEYRRAAPLMHRLRSIKSEPEIGLIRQAIDHTSKAFHRVLQFVRPGVKEYEVEAEMTHEFLFAGLSGHAYQPIIASGANACSLHYNENSQECRDGDLLLMDFGAEYGNYAADITRTIPVNGKFTGRQRECYEAVLRVLREATKMLVVGNTIDNVNREVNRKMEREMIGLGLFTSGDVAKQDPEKPLFMKYFMHGTSHFLGLDVHDVGSKFEPFQPGMVFTCEPGLYIQEEKMGIRLENNILVTDGGPVELSADVPIEPGDIERLMAGS